ncbi:hypothetical protein DYD21_16235 [Rhodohalobacter sp. SW132]|uniref:hypothetical protein n=1 Tax=Rhodohalobacter sp. SW132 TaxID=2293433 RepID=UPI000E23077A|nr:hypothetical protein [Rhodohalobacter sp. SW132]REL25061.1 hypothetical protein DYD21_16235 [Rhodohalobacter sp. SW132]
MTELSELWLFGMLLAAFAGGAFGAAIGALPAFIFTGFLVMLGESVKILAGDLSGVAGFDPSSLDQAAAITDQLGFGPLFGPHISFAAGAAASAYAAKKGYMDTGFPYHEAKNIIYAHGPKPDVLIVGGLFGILGYWITTLSVAFNLPWDPIAVAVVLSAFAHRLFLGYPLMGKAEEGILNMKPFKDGKERTQKLAGETKIRLKVEPWLGHQYKWVDVSLLGVVVGILAAFVTYTTSSVFLPFGISAALLLFLNLGVANIPVTHHMALVGSTAVVASTGGEFMEYSMAIMLLTGGLFGFIAALFGELIQRMFYAHADTHLDPPAAAIVLGTLLIAILAMIGIFPSAAWVPLPF